MQRLPIGSIWLDTQLLMVADLFRSILDGFRFPPAKKSVIIRLILAKA